MEQKHSNGLEQIEIPELQVHSIWKRLINKVRRVGFIYWVFFTLTALIISLALIPKDTLQRFWAKVEEQKPLVTLILIFCILALSLIWEKGQRIDVWVFNLLNMRGNRSKCVDMAMLGTTQLGSGVFAALIAIYFYLFTDHLLAYEVILGGLSLWLVVEIMKLVIRRKRPFNNLKDIRIVGERARGHSFPSGHTSQAFFLATLFIQHFSAGIMGAIVLYSIALIVGITRIYIGVHYPRDVVAGSVLGIAWGIVWAIINAFIR